ncbi:MAG: bifunctional UDP-N-acetylglucosamine diphosphorylase/glucosamine-1-phosphate N-acetyltransferase GlmU [Acidobacteria bacterium]|nr:bifunctional UDP-N-acetylglucosamine diphosphorylase/glucosamine-1-phosphate N-acetyltransferase GlmU [Acidobacteriota bacterium]
MDLNILIMAAGLGTRMKSQKAKVLHKLVGQPLINHVYQAALGLSPKRVVFIVGHQASDVEQVLKHFHNKLSKKEEHNNSRPTPPEFVSQIEQKGTGHAVMMAKELLAKDSTPILVLSGDVPLITSNTLKSLFSNHKELNVTATVLSTKVANPAGYGRIIRNEENNFSHIVEHRDANAKELEIDEINSGIYCFESQALFSALERISPNNAQGEYYLTDVLSAISSQNKKVAVYQHMNPEEVLGINNRIELASAEHRMRTTKLESLMLEGVTLIDPASTFIDLDVKIGMDTVIYPNTIIEGETTIGANCTISTGAHLINSHLANNVFIRDYSLIADSFLADQTTVGPFAHLRMGTHLENGSTIGNFVEVKKSRIGQHTKAMHLSYLGDATIGASVNIGAGTITCNYDGKNKHATIIDDNVKIGSDTMLVAPVRVGQGSMTGAGSVVTKDIPENSLAIGIPAIVKRTLTKT